MPSSTSSIRIKIPLISNIQALHNKQLDQHQRRRPSYNSPCGKAVCPGSAPPVVSSVQVKRSSGFEDCLSSKILRVSVQVLQYLNKFNGHQASSSRGLPLSGSPSHKTTSQQPAVRLCQRQPLRTRKHCKPKTTSSYRLDIRRRRQDNLIIS